MDREPRSCRIEPMAPAHLDGVVAVEAQSFATPWSREAFRYELEENRLARYFVALDGDRVAGYGGLWAILREGHITNIAVHPDYRRRGVGRALLQTLMLHAIRSGLRDLTLEVRESNTAAIRLYQAAGFVVEGRRQAYYQDNREDALIMWRHFDG